MDKEDKEYLSLKMEELISYIAREYVKDWLLDDGLRIVPPISQELNDMYEKGWAACEKLWSDKEIENNIVEMKFVYEPEPFTEKRWRTQLKLLAESLYDSQKEYNKKDI